jgi:hypothetical protein
VGDRWLSTPSSAFTGSGAAPGCPSRGRRKCRFRHEATASRLGAVSAYISVGLIWSLDWRRSPSENEFMENDKGRRTRGGRPGDGASWLWWTIGGCCFVAVAAPIFIRPRPVPMKALAVWGGAIALIVGVAAAIVRIAWTKGKPLGDRDPVRDRTSPYLRLSQRYGLAFTVGLVALSLAGLTFEVYWYPRPDPFVPVTAEQYVLGPLVLELFLLALGIYLSVVQLFWLRVVRRAPARP